MSIRSIGTPYGVQRPAAPTPAASTPAVDPGASPKPQAARARQDSVAISDAGRALAGGAAADGAQASGGLTPERVADLRRKVLEGAYNQTAVVDQVARRMLASGDV